MKRSRGHEEETIRNREQTLGRSRQWEIVDSDEEEVSNNEVKNVNSDNYSSNNDSDDSDDSESESSEDEKKHKKTEKKSKKDKLEKKEKKEKKSKKDKKEKKEKKEKKSKKYKKEKKHRKEINKSSPYSHAINQNEYGKYGVINETNFYHKQREFEAYMDEVKKMPGILGQSKREIMTYFKSFIEDYNTATMPHEKFYSYERWEIEEYKRKQHERSNSTDFEKVQFNDAEERRIELKKQKELDEKREFELTIKKMTFDKERMEGMRLQSVIQLEIQAAYKIGDMATVKKLETRLAPDAKVDVKHPWA
jgi:hypothetical protein